MKEKTLVFSIALNGYQWIYQKELRSQREYSKRFNYDYQAITKPAFTPLGVECCWLKLTLMRNALLSGYDNVMFIDADAFVSSSCPAINCVFLEDRYLFMAKGYSDRFNSGVIIARSNAQVLHWLTHVIDNRESDILEENSVGWGENGHIIEHSKGCNFIGEIEQKWNNTFDPSLDDFIQHKNSGPLRTSIINNFLHRLIFFLSNRALKIINKVNFLKKKIMLNDLLHDETYKISKLYEEFTLVKAKK